MGKSKTFYSLYSSTLFLLLLPMPSYAIPPLHTFIHGSCSTTRHVSNTTAHHIASLFATLLNSTSISTFHHTTLTQNDVVLHSLYQCRGDLSPLNCTSCVAHSISLLSSTCHLSSSATIQLQGCYVTYAPNASFWGVDETNVVYKKFGGKGIIDGRYVEREKVLNGLVVGVSCNGPFRTVGSNGILGQAQCHEDLSADRCQGCLETAVKLLKTDSGDSGRGDVFLPKCYARYSCNTGYNTGRSSDDGVKTFSLIAGLLAGIVVVIVFLTFVCREFAGSSK